MAARTNADTELRLPLLQRLFRVGYEYERIIDQQRARALAVTCVVVGGGAVGFVAFLELLFPAALNAVNVIATLLLAVACLATYFLVNRGQLTLAGLLLVASFQVVLLVQFRLEGIHPLLGLAFSLPIVIAAVVLPRRWAAGVLLVSVGFLAIPVFFPLAGVANTTSAAPLSLLFAYALLLTLVTLVVTTLARQLADATVNRERVARRLEAAAVVSDVASTLPSLRELLETVVERIRSAYDFYHAQVFLLDKEGRMARLEASTGRAGEALLSRAHALPVGSKSVVGLCTATGEPVVVNDTERSDIHRANSLLPRTRAELALPLIVGGEVIGAIDVQSVERNVFQPDDVRSLQVMAAQLAATISQVRLIGELQASAAENRVLLEEAQRSLRKIEDLNRRMTREGWQDYLRARRAQGALGFSLDEGSLTTADTWSAPMRQAYQAEGSVIVRQDNQSHVAAVPIRIRGQVVGVLEIERDGHRPWTEDDLAMAETLVDRLGLAIENARLYEQATQAVEREQLVNRIGQEVQAAESIDDVLRTALAELSSVLGASRGVVQISPGEEAQP